MDRFLRIYVLTCSVIVAFQVAFPRLLMFRRLWESWVPNILWWVPGH